MATQTEISMLETRLMVLDLQIEDIQKKRADLYMEYKIKKAENELQDTKF